MRSLLVLVILWNCCARGTATTGGGVLEACEAGGTELDASSPGVVVTPGWPNGTYPSNSQCEWTIRQQEGKILELRFLNFTVELSEQCKSDYVEVYDGEDDGAEIVGRFCGQRIPPPITASGDALFMRFVSDASIEYSGFLARYGEMVSRIACSESGPEVITANNGTISTEDYPAPYPNNAQCGWSFQGEEGQRWQILFVHTELENCCMCDYVEIYDGPDVSSPRIGRWFGLNSRIPVIQSSSNSLYVTFVSDYTLNFQGFAAAYSKVQGDAELPVLVAA